ncbi:hypothetical protein RZS08_09455, partial [Arthrospira platensis SPKY1]|nr:hypothetical protein [Arthrospira platensis SPKY1]
PVARPVLREAEQTLTRAPSPRPAATATPGSQLWTTVQGESVASIAQALYPRDEGARRAFVNGVIRGNPQVFDGSRHPAAVLPPGTELRIPGLAGVAAASTERPRAASTVATAPAPSETVRPAPDRAEPVSPTPAPAPVVAERDRLVVDTGARDELAARQIDTQASDETIREERLVAAIDRSIDAQLEL